MLDGMTTLLLLVNIALSGGGVVYLVRVEHRFTALETQMRIVLLRLRLAGE